MEGMGIPVTFTVVSGSWPPGLTLNATTGEITNTPTTPGTYEFMVQISNGCTPEYAPDSVTESDTQKLVAIIVT